MNASPLPPSRPLRASAPVVVAGGTASVRAMVRDALASLPAVAAFHLLDEVTAFAGDRAAAGEPPPVVVVLDHALAAGLDAVASLRRHLGADAPMLLLVEEPDALPRSLDGLPDGILRGRWERTDLLLRVRALVDLADARHRLAQATRELLENRLAADRARRALETERATFQQVSRYVSPGVLEQLQNGSLALPPSRQEVSVLFSDIRGFTDASAFATPEDLMDLLNDYLPEVNRIIRDEGGHLDKFMGDGILVYFRANANVTDIAARAVRSAVRLLERLEELKVTWFERGFLPVGVGVGVTTGGAIMGSIGRGDRMDHTIIGPTVNLAARLQGLARGGEVVIDQATWEQARGQVRVRDGRKVHVKGFEDPVTVYTVTGLGG